MKRVQMNLTEIEAQLIQAYRTAVHSRHWQTFFDESNRVIHTLWEAEDHDKDTAEIIPLRKGEEG